MVASCALFFSFILFIIILDVNAYIEFNVTVLCACNRFDSQSMDRKGNNNNKNERNGKRSIEIIIIQDFKHCFVSRQIEHKMYSLREY